MDDPRVVSDLDGPGQSDHQFCGLRARLWSPCEAVLQRSTLEQLQGNEWRAIGLADLENLDDVGMMEPGDSLGLDPDAGQMIGAAPSVSTDHLHGNLAIQSPLPRPIDDPHTSLAQQVEDLISGDSRQTGTGLAADRSHARNRASRLPRVRGSVICSHLARREIGRDPIAGDGRLSIEPGCELAPRCPGGETPRRRRSRLRADRLAPEPRHWDLQGLSTRQGCS